VQHALYFILGAEVGDESLALLDVVSVEPAPDSTRLLVTLKRPESMTTEEALERLQVAGKAIRSEVAASIHRKKVPDLVYRVV
jgi:ribosome-binding factor A